MHEMSIALDVGRIAEERAGAGGPAQVVTVALDVGYEAGVEFENLEFCLEAVLSQPPFGRARAIINRVPGDVLRVTYLELDDAPAVA